MAKIGLQQNKTAVQWADAAVAAGGVREALATNLGTDSLAPSVSAEFRHLVLAAEQYYLTQQDPIVALQAEVDAIATPPEEP